jgi:hypothetical protein
LTKKYGFNSAQSLINKILALSAKLVKINIDSRNPDARIKARNYLFTLAWALKSINANGYNGSLEVYTKNIEEFTDAEIEKWVLNEINYLETIMWVK